MGRIYIQTFINASPEVCFDLARDVGAHLESASFSGERAVAPGRTKGLLELGDLVTFEGVHFGVRQRFTAKITELDRPHRFVDELVKSTFKRLRHVHDFVARDGGTLMVDDLEWTSPLGILGRIADAIAVERHMGSFVTRKQRALKEMAERW
jgi:ligand-binding SRPBCC domain-containing protein